MAARYSILQFDRKLSDTKLKMIATDSIIRKVRAGELDIEIIRDQIRQSRHVHIKGIKFVMWQLEVLTAKCPPELIQSELKLSDDIPEEEKKILLLNKKKQMDMLNKETALLLDIMLGKKITHEHKEFLRKEYHRLGTQF